MRQLCKGNVAVVKGAILLPNIRPDVTAHTLHPLTLLRLRVRTWINRARPWSSRAYRRSSPQESRTPALLAQQSRQEDGALYYSYISFTELPHIRLLVPLRMPCPLLLCGKR